MPDIDIPAFEIRNEPIDDPLTVDPGDSIAGIVWIWRDEASGSWERAWRRRSGSTRSVHTTPDAAVAAARDGISAAFARWEKRATEHDAGVDNKGYQVIAVGGIAYTIAPDLDAGTPSHLAGYGGQRSVLRLIATGEQIETRNLWMYGHIPSEFRGRIPNNAEWVTGDE